MLDSTATGDWRRPTTIVLSEEGFELPLKPLPTYGSICHAILDYKRCQTSLSPSLSVRRKSRALLGRCIQSQVAIVAIYNCALAAAEFVKAWKQLQRALSFLLTAEIYRGEEGSGCWRDPAARRGAGQSAARSTGGYFTAYIISK